MCYNMSSKLTLAKETFPTSITEMHGSIVMEQMFSKLFMIDEFQKASWLSALNFFWI